MAVVMVKTPSLMAEYDDAKYNTLKSKYVDADCSVVVGPSRNFL